MPNEAWKGRDSHANVIARHQALTFLHGVDDLVEGNEHEQYVKKV